MTAASDQPTRTPHNRDTAAGVPSFILWLGALAVCLACAWRNIILTGQSLPAQPHALRLLYSAELLTAAALFPMLFLTLPRIVLVLATGFLALQLAGHIQAAHVTTSLSYSGQFLLFSLALTLWSTRRHRIGLIALLLTIWLVAPPLLYAVFRDFSTSLLVPNALLAISPLLTPAPWLLQTIHLAIALAIVIISQTVRSRHANR
jgi:hypothetical protein